MSGEGLRRPLSVTVSGQVLAEVFRPLNETVARRLQVASCRISSLCLANTKIELV